MSALFPIYDVPSAQASILKRQAPDEVEVPVSLLDGIERRFGERLSPEEAVKRILRDVRQRGDAAVREWVKRIDGQDLASLALSPAQIASAHERLSPALIQAVAFAAQRIRRFHEMQPKLSWINSLPEGLLGQLVRPIERVGIYVPGGTAPLLSTLLMCAIPAQVAGVKEIIVCTPKENDGISQAAATIGLEQVFLVGGAQAIAAMAYGTESIPRVDKIVGPGNLFVTIAKRQVYGVVGIDGLLGPTETMVIADDSANPEFVAADLLAQAEHELLASAILLTPSPALAQQVEAAIERQLTRLERAEVIRQSLPRNGGAVITADLAQAFALANAYAPEHLCLLIQDAAQWLGMVQNAGGVFLGEQSFEVLGDYVAGPSHSMPTSGTARFASPLNVLDFVKITSLIGLNALAASDLSQQAAFLATAEELGAHAAAALQRVQGA